jgi:carbon-monoxide dehydrogenase large subunit
MQLGRPVRWIEDRAEHLIAACHAREQLHDMQAAIDDSGHILALCCTITCDVGSGEIFPPGVNTSLVSSGILTGPYRIPHADVRTVCVVTNKTPSGAYRGFGTPEAVFAMERLVEDIARVVGRDALQLRREMLIAPEDLPYTMPSGARLDSGSHRAAFERAVALADAVARQERARLASQPALRVGMGVATAVEGVVPTYFGTTGHWTSHDAATLRIDPDGGVVASVGVSTAGQGLKTMVATVTAEALGVSPEQVSVVIGDTDLCPYGLGGWGSRSTVVAGGAILKAAATLREKLLRIAAGVLEAAPEDLRIEQGRVRVVGSGRGLSLAELSTLAHIRTLDLPPGVEPGLEASATYDPPGLEHRPDENGRINACATYTNATHAAVVAVDVATGQVELLRYIVVHDCGTVLNPAIVAGQIAGGVAQAIGGALYEELAYSSEGMPLSTTFMDYLLPSATEIPSITIEHMESPAPDMPLGAKGTGESGTIGPFAAIASAVTNALAEYDVRISELPMSPAVIRRLLRDRQRAPDGPVQTAVHMP